MKGDTWPLVRHEQRIRIFFHPDFTVASGIAPDQPSIRGVAGFTAGRESPAANQVGLQGHPALKNRYETIDPRLGSQRC